MADLLLILLFALLVGLGTIMFVLFSQKSRTDKAQSEAIRDMERRMTDLMQRELKEIRGSVDGTSEKMHKQIHSFTRETTKMRKDLKAMQEKIKDISSFQEIFKAPKLRGQWGEANLEYILSQYYPEKLYDVQHTFSSGLQVDAVLNLPNDKMLPIDAKFSSENFTKMVEAEGEEEKDFFRKKFARDLKKQIDSISEKYILPGEGTVDFALMYVPAEAVYYEIINSLSKDFGVINYGWERQVILASPNTFYLTLRTIEYWFRDTELSRHAQKILKKLERVRKDGKKLTNEFRKLGKHISHARSAYERSKKRLSLLGRRTKKLIEKEELEKIEE